MFTEEQWEALMDYITDEVVYQIKDYNTKQKQYTIDDVLIAEQYMQGSYDRMYNLIMGGTP